MSRDTKAMQPPAPTLSSTTYIAVLQAYLQGAGEHALQQAYEIGRNALSAGGSLLALAQLHHAALETLLQTPSAHERRHVISAAAEFFAECISPYEMTYSGFREANKVLRHFNDVLEQEAKRISHALHDEAGQLLVALYIALENMARDVPAAREHTVKATALLDQIETQLRRLSHELTPVLLNDLGLAPALHYLAEGLMQRAKLSITIECVTEQRLPRPVESVLYRIAQEALNNVLRHAQASEVSIRIEADHSSAFCRIRDNGVGFDVDAVKARDGERGFGLIGMRERLAVVAGELHIHSTLGQGAELVARVPLEH